MAFVATYVADILQTFMLNEEYEKVLRPRIADKVEDFIYAMCTYLTNPALHACVDAKNKKKITKEQYDALNSPIDYIVDKSRELIQNYLNSIKDPNMLEYIPQNQQIGVPIVGGKAAGSGENNTEVPTIIPAMVSPDTLTSKLGSSIPGMDMSKTVTDKFKSNKATDIMEFLMEQIILKLKCDNNMHELIKDKIIGSIFKMADKNIDKYGVELLLPLIKVTTQQHVKKYVPLLTNQLNTYQLVLASVTPILTTDSGKNIITVIIPHYMNLLFELFVYSEYGLIVDIDVGITRNGIKPYITSLNEFKEKVNAHLAKYNYPADVMHLNNIKIPDSWKTDGTGADNDTVITDAHVIDEFKKLFEHDAAKKKGGNRKTYTKKRKTMDLPVTKHGSRRKHP